MNEIRLLHVIAEIFCGSNNNLVYEQLDTTSLHIIISIMGQSANNISNKIKITDTLYETTQTN